MAKVAAMLAAAQASTSFKAADLAMASVDAMSSEPQPSVAENGVVGDAQVLLRDVRNLVRQGCVAPPTGFTKLGHPILFFPAESEGVVVAGRGSNLAAVPESDLHLLFKYYLAVVPRTEQASGFALIIDRRLDDWSSVRTVFKKVVSLFPAR